MRGAWKAIASGAGTFCVWAAILLVFPGCRQILGLDPPILVPPENLPKGDLPHDAAIFCDIEKALGRHCATARDLEVGIRLSHAAIALAEGRTSNVGLDDSPDALARCSGQPEAVLFEGPFPQGMPVCLNCGTIATNFYNDNNAACRAACYDLYGTVNSTGDFMPDVPPSPAVASFCDAHARASTNFPVAGCADGACTPEGSFQYWLFEDPRKYPARVTWTDTIGTVVSGVDLLRMATTGAAGAASTEWIARGDAYVEFGITRSHRLGWSEIPPGCASPCPDTIASPADIRFGIDVDANGRLFVIDNGVQFGPFGTFPPTLRFRVNLRDNGDGSATVSYSRLLASCAPGTICSTADIPVISAARPRYPFRVDASILSAGASILDAQLVYVK